jgi:hypothetical protein
MIGLDVFRAALGKHEGKFVLIGGMAAAVQAEEIGLQFRPTKDFDIVLVLEALDKNFFDDFWKFVEAGGYVFEKGSGEKQFYRFNKPTMDGYPAQLELFARKPNIIDLPEGAHLTPIPADEEAASLSAILLDENYYECLLQGRITVNGIPVLGPAMMIPFKARAYLDMEQRQREGQAVKPKDIAKHRTDVFRLLGMLNPETQIAITAPIKEDLARFLQLVAADNAFDPQAVTGVAKAEAIARITTLYGLS